jgi:SAM-dependent methyltransferase
MIGSQAMKKALYASPKTVQRLEECYFYHTMDIPGYGRVEGDWDLTAATADYLGNVDFAGKRVLEVGPASGYLAFEMEKRGASVVSVDVDDNFVFDVVPFNGINRKENSDGFLGAQRMVQSGYWLAHKAMNSKNQVHYGSGYKIPAELGKFDIGLLASILLHNSNPIMIADQVARLTTDKLIIVDLCHGEIPGAQHLPTIQLYPSVDNQIWHTWWRFSESFFVELLKILGFPKINITRSTQFYKNQPYTLHTIVGER